ncbi:LOW QUALITY PROTEIN: serine/threonine-protein phosphatase 1 regulatory subunit 10-like, partial [Cuculus canorus]|uniref:LOW QUALITY PROTEIN: serine/threonine-protein phosphatase 1 regulatory subunit 10-like n=1 Tax=Cuculus canorus TaxID=55661 RepID=UPI0023AAFB30
MGSGAIDPKELLKGLDCFLGHNGEVKNMDSISKIFNLMKDAQKLVSRCIYLNILMQTRSQDILAEFIRIGGYKLLNTWLTAAKASNNVAFLQQILLTLQHLPLTVDHLKQNNTAKLVKRLSKSHDNEELRQLAAILVSDWMGVIRSHSSVQPAERDRKRRREENKSKMVVQEKPQETKAEAKAEEVPEKKREKPKSLRTTAPSHAKFRSTGLEMETPSSAPTKKMRSASGADKYGLKPMPVKRQNVSVLSGEAAPAKKKYKPLNTAPNAAKEIKVKTIPPQPVEVPEPMEFCESRRISWKGKQRRQGLHWELSPLVPPTGLAESSMDVRSMENPLESGPMAKKARKKKTVSWAEEEKLCQYFYFEWDETERVNVNKMKGFGEAARWEMLKDWEAFETARRLSHDAMEEKVPWVYPRLLDLPAPLVVPGSSSCERFIQAEREKGILQEIFLSKESVPDSPHEPDLESCEPLPPKLIPLDEDCSAEEAVYPNTMDTSAASPAADASAGAKLLPILANLMGSVGAGKSPQGPVPATTINVQEILTSIMGGPSPHKAEELLKQEYSEKIKHLLGNLQAQPTGPGGVPHGLLGPGPMATGFPPGPKGLQQFPPGGPLPGPHGGGGGGGPSLPPGPGMPGGPRLLGPPPPQRGGNEFWDALDWGGVVSRAAEPPRLPPLHDEGQVP